MMKQSYAGRAQLALALTALASLLPGAAQAHAFKYGSGPYMDFVTGNSVVLTDPFLIVAAAATGLAFAIWREDGMPLAWPGLLLGTVIGALVAGYDPVEPVFAAAICGFGMGVLGALAANAPVWPMRIFALVAGVLLAIATLSGHEAGTIPGWSYVGVVFAINIAVVMIAGLAVTARTKFTQGWMMIALRALSSWMIALTVMMGTLALAGK